MKWELYFGTEGVLDMLLWDDNDFQMPKGQPVRFYYNYLKYVWITSFFYDWVWLRLFLKPAN